MAIRLDTTSEAIRRTSDLIDPDNPYTFMFWVYFVSFGGWEIVFGIGVDEYSDSDYIHLNYSHQWLLGVNGNEQTASGPSTGIWYPAAIVRASSTDLRLFVNGSQVLQNTANCGSRSEGYMGCGVDPTPSGDSPMARFAGIKAWSTNLTVDEIRQEIYRIAPVKTTNLYGWWPCFLGSGERDKDYSGNGRDWSEIGSPSDEDGPPLSWGAPVWQIPFVSAAEPLSIDLEPDLAMVRGVVIYTP